ncbi:hypothetical protein EMCRGX_G029423 [Ephydatia muelleri]
MPRSGNNSDISTNSNSTIRRERRAGSPAEGLLVYSPAGGCRRIVAPSAAADAPTDVDKPPFDGVNRGISTDSGADNVDPIGVGGWTALMNALVAGHMECVQVLLDQGADVNMQSEDGTTALMMASQAGHMECVQVLLDKGADVNMQRESGDTALHLAVRAKVVQEKDQISCVRTLLFHPGIDVNLKNFEGRTAMGDAGYGPLSVFNQVLKTCNDFPADSYGKVVLCGNSGAGKSTLTQVVLHDLRGETESVYANVVKQPEWCELAGYHGATGAAHGQALAECSPPQPGTQHLWRRLCSLSIAAACQKELSYLKAAAIGCEELADDVLRVFGREGVVGPLTAGIIPHQIDSPYSNMIIYDLAGHHQFFSSHSACLEAISLNSPAIFLLLQDVTKDSETMAKEERLPRDMHAILLSDLLIRLDTDQDKFINPDITAVVPLLKTLSEKGLIVFIPSEDPHSSWVVHDKESILKNVNGALFADPVLKKSTGLASTTGIISTAVLKKAFPDYNCDMITQFMVHFEIGQAVDLSQIKTNMAPEGSINSDLGPLLFIPALVSIDRPSSATVPNNSFCWSEIVKCTDQFFTPRFHHVLLHRLPLTFARPEKQTTSINSQPTLNRLCDVWSRGIKWLSETGVTTVVEMSESFQAISLTMFSPNKASPKYLELAHSVREVIKKARQEFCPYLEVLEVVSCLPECSSDHSIDTRVELSRLRKAILEKETHVGDVSGTRSVAIDEWKKMEPLLSSLLEACTVTGQVLPPVEDPITASLTADDHTKIYQTTISASDRWRAIGGVLGFTFDELDSIVQRGLNIVEQIEVNYLMFGMILLQDDNGAIVKALEEEHRGNAEKINKAIFQKWLDGKGIGRVTWSTLVTALQCGNDLCVE